MYSGHQRVHEDEGFNPFQSQSAHLPNSRPSGMMETNRVPSRLPDAHPLHPVGPSLPPVQGSQPIYGGVGPYDIDPLDPTPYPGYPTEPQGPAPDQNQPQGPPPSQQQHFQNAPQHDAPTYAPSSSPMQNPPAQPMFNTHHPEQRPVRLSQRQPQQQPAHAPFVTTNNHAPSRTAPYQTMHGVPRAAWFTNDNLPRTQQPATYIPGSSRQNHAPYQFHARDASVSSSSSTTDIANIDSPMGPSPTYGSPAEIDQSHSYALQQYAPPSLPPPRAPVSSAIVGTVPPDVEEQSPTDDGNAVALNTVQPGANTMFVDGIPVPPHQQYYPRSAWGPPPPRKVVQARMEEQRRLQQAQASGVRSGGSSDVSLSNTVNPAALGGSGSKRKQPPESDAVADIANVEMTNPTSGDLDNLVDGYSDNEKPPYPLSTILKFTLLGSPRGKLTLAEIYDTLMARFPFFKHVKTDWQNSVRHTLSLHVCFVRVARAITDPGKGSYWTYEPSRGDGINRKRRPKKKKGDVAEAPDRAHECIEVHDSSPDDSTHDDDRTVQPTDASRFSVTKSTTYQQSPLGRPDLSSVQSSTLFTSANEAASAATRDVAPTYPGATTADQHQRTGDHQHDIDVDQELVFMAWGPPATSPPPAIPAALTSAEVLSNSAPGPSRGALDQLEYSSSSGSATDRDEGTNDSPATRHSENQTQAVATTSQRRHMTQQEEQEAEELRRRDLGELLELRQARKRKEQERGDRRKAPQRQEPMPRSRNRAEPLWSDDEPSPATGTVSARRKPSTGTRATKGESGSKSTCTAVSTNKYLPVQRTPPPEHLQQLQHIQQSWNGRFVIGVPISMPPPFGSRLPTGNSPPGSDSPVPDNPIPHAYSPVSPQLSPVRPNQSVPSPIAPTTLAMSDSVSAAWVGQSAQTQQQARPPADNNTGTAPQSQHPPQAPYPRPRPRPQSQANTQALSQSLSSRALGHTQETSPLGGTSQTEDLAASMTQTASLTQGQYAQYAFSAQETSQQLQAQRRVEDTDTLLNDAAAMRDYAAQYDPSKIKRGPSGRARIPLDPEAIARFKAQKAAQQQHSAQSQGEGPSGG